MKNKNKTSTKELIAWAEKEIAQYQDFIKKLKEEENKNGKRNQKENKEE